MLLGLLDLLLDLLDLLLDLLLDPAPRTDPGGLATAPRFRTTARARSAAPDADPCTWAPGA